LFRPVRVPKAADEVITMIADAIRSGFYRQGEHLPTQVELAERFKVSRNVVHEAIEALRRAGIVSVRRGSTDGVRVESTANLHQVITAIGGEVQATLIAALEARRPLELTAAILTAERATAEELQRLGALVQELELALDNPDEFLQVDAMFHFRLGELSGNPLIRQFLRVTLDRILSEERALLERFSSTGSPIGQTHRLRALEHQRGTFAAIETKDHDLIFRAVDDHLGAFEETLLGKTLNS
jgi:GntR family transcriptional repressor for pyruvate dehydrogenase complex